MLQNASRHSILTVFSLTTLAALPASALTDEKTGFGVTPPTPFVAEASTHPAQDILFGINSTTGTPAIAGAGKHLCGAGLKANDENAKLSQAQINAQTDGDAWRTMVRMTVGHTMAIDSETPFEIAGAHGVELIATPKIGPDHENVSMFLNIVDAPRGRVSFTCAVKKADFAGALDSLRAIRATITLPK